MSTCDFNGRGRRGVLLSFSMEEHGRLRSGLVVVRAKVSDFSAWTSERMY